MNIWEKVIIVTWSSDWIWKEIAFSLAKEWSSLALISRNEEKLTLVKKEAEKLGAKKVHIYPCNICETATLKQTIWQIYSDFWAIHVLINNAWIRQKLSQVDEIDPDMIDQIVQTNLLWVIHATQIVLPYLRKEEQTAIINISSKSWHVPQQGQSVYAATKFWVRGFTEVLKLDLKETNIRVAWIYQSWTNTQMFKKTWEDFPLEKFTDPKDLADVITHMLSMPKKIWLHDVRVQY